MVNRLNTKSINHFKKVIFSIPGGINYNIFKKPLNNFFI